MKSPPVPVEQTVPILRIVGGDFTVVGNDVTATLVPVRPVVCLATIVHHRLAVQTVPKPGVRLVILAKQPRVFVNLRPPHAQPIHNVLLARSVPTVFVS